MAIESKIISPGQLADKLREISNNVEKLAQQQHEVKVSCPNCQGTKFTYDETLGDDGHLLCEKCGTDLGTRGEATREAVVKAAREKLNDALK